MFLKSEIKKLQIERRIMIIHKKIYIYILKKSNSVYLKSFNMIELTSKYM